MRPINEEQALAEIVQTLTVDHGCHAVIRSGFGGMAPTLQPRRAMVIISRLVAVNDWPPQSPNCFSITRPESVKNDESDPASRNLRVLWLICGRSQLGLVNVWVNETMSPTTGVWTSRAIR